MSHSDLMDGFFFVTGLVLAVTFISIVLHMIEDGPHVDD